MSASGLLLIELPLESHIELPIELPSASVITPPPWLLKASRGVQALALLKGRAAALLVVVRVAAREVAKVARVAARLEVIVSRAVRCITVPHSIPTGRQQGLQWVVAAREASRVDHEKVGKWKKSECNSFAICTDNCSVFQPGNVTVI